MSLVFLPRGVAAKRAAGNEDSTMTPPDDHEDVQMDAPSAISASRSPEQHSGLESSQRQRWPRQRDTSDRAARGSGRFQQRHTPSIKPKELAVLIEVAMSDYALWNYPPLQRYAADRGTSGYLALARLLNESPIIRATGHTIAEPSVFQALKDYGTGVLELQMKLNSSKTRKRDPPGDNLYNLRRVDWQGIRHKVDPANEAVSLWSRSQESWNERTVYLENIPRKHWPLASALSFVHSCIGGDNPSTVQNLELPAHAKASEGDIPAGKGFAFVTFETAQDANGFLEKWSWEGVAHRSETLKAAASDDDSDDGNFQDQLMNLDITKEKNLHEEAVKEGVESGLRAMSLTRWEQLKNEYLGWQSEMLEKVKASQAAQNHQRTKQASSSSPYSAGEAKPPRDHQIPPHMMAVAAAASPEDRGDVDYPQGCLIFVRNIHPQTNKTTLKKLFERALQEANGSADGVDYVDWSKGMSSCHLRLSNAHVASMLATHLDKNSLVQIDGSDPHLVPLSEVETDPRVVKLGLRAIVAELVHGRAAAIYWDKVPDKIKALAITKALQSSQTLLQERDAEPEDPQSAALKRASEEPREDERESKRRRKA